MPFTLDAFARRRPYLFHLTSRENLRRLRRDRRMEGAAMVLERGGRTDLLRTRRTKHEEITVDGERILLRDQSPLHEGNIAFEGEWGMEDLVEQLNRRVYFWPGTGDTTPPDPAQSTPSG